LAQVVAAYGLPHTPFFPWLVQKDGPQSPTGQLFAKARASLEAARPDVIVILDTDHLNTFFLDNLPVFAVGVTEAFTGPNDEPRAVPVYTIRSLPQLATHIRERAVRAGFDVALLQDFEVDHSVIVPLHFVTPDMGIPVIPVFINGHIPPLPSAQRCFGLGAAIRTAIEGWSHPLRVAVVGTGSFSLEVWGPRIDPGKSDGVPDPDWVHQVCGHIQQSDVAGLITAATEARMLQAGNVGGELLNWIAMLAFVGSRRPDFLEKQIENGHAYAGWRWS
jgi:hypothetical protein